MIRNTPFLAILLMIILLNLFYFTPRVPKPDHVYNRFKYAFTGEEKNKVTAETSFVDSSNVAGLGSGGDVSTAGPGDDSLKGLNVQEHQSDRQDEGTTLQNLADSLDIEQAGLGKAIGQKEEQQSPPPPPPATTAAAAAQSELTSQDGNDPQLAETDKLNMEQLPPTKPEDSTPEDSAQQPPDAEAPAKADTKPSSTPSTATPLAPAGEIAAVPAAPVASVEAAKQVESSPKSEIELSRTIDGDKH